MKTLFRTAEELQFFFKNEGWRFCFIGGLALQRWGEPRLTVDIDVTLLTGFGNEEKFVAKLLAAYPSRIHDAEVFAKKNRVLLLKSGSGAGLDIALAGLPFEEKIINRASYFEFLPGLSLLTCSAEDLIVMKAFADRAKDWVDVKNIIDRSAGSLDQKNILERLAPLCDLKESPEIPEKLKALFKS